MVDNLSRLFVMIREETDAFLDRKGDQTMTGDFYLIVGILAAAIGGAWVASKFMKK